MDFEKLIGRCEAVMSEKNLTNRDVARMANISEATVSRTLTGRGQNASVATLIAICDALDVAAEPEEPARNIALEQVYQARIDDLKLVIANKERWIRRLFVVCLALVGFVLGALLIDMLNPDIGWIRHALGIGMFWGSRV